MPTVAFTGIVGIRKAVILKSRGAAPSKADLICDGQDKAPPSIGTLTLSDENATETWQDAAIVKAQRRHLTNTTGHLASVIVADRRWKWKERRISGVYNKRLLDGSVSTTNKKSVKELIDLIFQELGEQVDSANAPADLYPFTQWKNTRCDKAIDRLLSQVGCEITLDYQTNKAVVHKRGDGAALPSGREIEPKLVVTNGPTPNKLKLSGGPVLVQSKIKLVAIGIDNDGTWKKVDDLSYKPTDGWDWPMGFEGISSESDRALAQQSVWRCFALEEFAEGGLSIPQLPDVTISKPTQLLPLRERLLQADEDHNGVSRQNLPYLEGEWFFGPSGHSRYTGEWRILDKEYGIIYCETPTFKIESSAIVAPDLYITVAHHVRDADTDGLIYYEREKSLSAGDSVASTEVPELFRAIIREYSGTAPGTVTDNKTTVDAEADKYLDALEKNYSATDPPEAKRYRGFVFPKLDGAIAQVKHVLGGSQAYTDVSRLYEDDVFTPIQKEREWPKERESSVRVLPACGNVLKTAAHSVWGRITGTLSPLGSQTMRIWKEESGTMADTGIDITVYDRLLESTGSLTDKWRVRVEWDSDKYYVVGAACVADESATVWGS